MSYPILTLTAEELYSGCSFIHQHSANETYPLHSHSGFYEFFYTASGRAIHIINDRRAILLPNSLVLIRPDDVHCYEALSKYDFELITVGFPNETMYSVCNYMGIDMHKVDAPHMPPSVVLDGYNRSDILRKLLHMGRHEPGQDRHSYMLSMLPGLLYRVFNSYDATPEKDMPPWLYALIDKMSEKDNYIAGLQRMIALSGKTQEHVTREFSANLHMTPTEFINLKRLNLACSLLIENKKSIIDISYECGFSSLSHFYHCFKKQYGSSPKEFLKNYCSAN